MLMRCAMRIYVFHVDLVAIDVIKNSSIIIYEDNKLLRTHKEQY